MEEEIEPSYVNLVRECVEKIIGQELKMNPEAIVGVVRNALIDARQQREIIVRVNPADVEALNKNKNKLLEILARANAVEVREDASITRGGCMVMTELGAIDAQLERQLEALATALSAELTEADYGGVEEGELDPEDDPGYGSY
jgi:flagellar biosynthesis/type III secretory pathway protein FliH